MIYFYEIIIHYDLGNRYIEKTYTKSFNELVDFLIWVKEKHKNNFTIFSIKPKKYNNSKIRIRYLEINEEFKRKDKNEYFK